MKYTSATPAEINELADQHVSFFDIREPEAWRREHIPGSRSLPLDTLGDGHAFDFSEQDTVVFHCQKGIRTEQAAERLAGAVRPARVFLMQGGIDAWKKNGLSTVRDKRQPLPVMRQVHIVAGILILSGTGAGTLISSLFYVIPAVVGAGLLLAGISGWCGMARLLSLMPWNRRAP
ncbi:rhodanese family protein [Enterobacter hormaechei]|uniref:rhodanese family protein n=1 Tax=Enterobacter hormaechei TaxID=158836 RepID=UPI0021629A6F|nr:rhodanese family protein [Enterobacter hormaechei]MCS0522651.1 rhodanese family protein [Enterobacter hormaechei]